MCKPFDIKKDASIIEAIRNVTLGMSSTLSCLHSPPDPIGNPEEGALYLSDIDHMAQHAVEHLRHALHELIEVQKRVEREFHRLQFPDRCSKIFFETLDGDIVAKFKDGTFCNKQGAVAVESENDLSWVETPFDAAEYGIKQC